MTDHEASFISLFSRSRYAKWITSDDDSNGAEVDRFERERFAAASVGFCLKHSASFRNYFWRKVCRVDGDPNEVPELAIEVEPVHWADLRLSATTRFGRFVWVVECKAGSPLDSKQNPDDAKFSEVGTGYGAIFRSQEEQVVGNHLRYIVLGANEQSNIHRDSFRSGIFCTWRRWACLLEDRPLDSLEADLYDCLGQLGLSCFRMKEVEAIQVNADLQAVVDAWDVLTVLGGRDGCAFRSSYWRIAAGRPENNEFHLGAYLRRPHEQKKTSKLHHDLMSRLNPTGAILAWVGYESGSKIQNGFRRSVWLYCEDKKTAESFAKKLRTRIPEITTSVERDGDWCAVISADKKATTRDLNWFQAVLKAVGSKA